MDYEQKVMELIGAAGEGKDLAFQAMDALKEGDTKKAKELIAKSHETDVAAHNVQTSLISAEMDPEQENVPMTLLMAHAQDHFMTTQIARELIEHFIDIFDSMGDAAKTSVVSDKKDEEDEASDDDVDPEPTEDSPKQISRAKNIASKTLDDKMKILLCCEGGLSTNLLMQEMKKAVKNSQKLNTDNFEFAAIPLGELDRQIDNWDVILVGPQVGHRLNDVEKLCEQHNKPYQVIDKDVYGSVDGQTVVKMGIILYRKSKM